MALTLVIASLSILGMVALLIWKPSIKVGPIKLSTFYWPPLLGALLLLIFQNGLSDAFVANLISDAPTNPVKLLTLFFSMSFLSLALDEAGLFSYLASKAIAYGKDQMSLFVLIYFVTGLLTVFTSNDIVVLTFTPFILSFCKRAKISPLPFLMEEFVAANTFSMALLIGNPTNIYLSESAGFGFFKYLEVLLLPTTLAAGVSFLMLFLLFRKSLSAPLEAHAEVEPLKDKVATIVGVVNLGICILLLSISSFIQVEMHLICFLFCAAEFLFLLFYCVSKDIKEEDHPYSLLIHSVKRVPYALIPFLLSMFTIVDALSLSGVNAAVAGALANLPPIYGVGVASFLSCSLMNNIPMSVLFADLIPAVGGNYVANYYAAVIGSNLGALLTPLGALAGIMWMNMLDGKGCHISFARFTKCGLAISLISLLFALSGLQLSLLIFQ